MIPITDEYEDLDELVELLWVIPLIDHLILGLSPSILHVWFGFPSFLVSRDAATKVSSIVF